MASVSTGRPTPLLRRSGPCAKEPAAHATLFSVATAGLITSSQLRRSTHERGWTPDARTTASPGDQRSCFLTSSSIEAAVPRARRRRPTVHWAKENDGMPLSVALVERETPRFRVYERQAANLQTQRTGLLAHKGIVPACAEKCRRILTSPARRQHACRSPNVSTGDSIAAGFNPSAWSLSFR